MSCAVFCKQIPGPFTHFMDTDHILLSYLYFVYTNRYSMSDVKITLQTTFSRNSFPDTQCMPVKRFFFSIPPWCETKHMTEWLADVCASHCTTTAHIVFYILLTYLPKCSVFHVRTCRGKLRMLSQLLFSWQLQTDITFTCMVYVLLLVVYLLQHDAVNPSFCGCSYS